MKLVAIIDKLAIAFPKKDAADWDFVGWQVKSKNKDIEIDHILVSLDVTEAVIDRAIKDNIKLIISHHPFIFAKRISDLTNSKWKKSLYQKLITHEINVFVLHTNFDKNPKGMSYLIAQGLKLNSIKAFALDEFSVVGQYDNLSLKKVINLVKEYYHFDKLKVITNDLHTKINKVVVAAGAGGMTVEFLKKSTDAKKDISLLITGEIKWHQELEARDKNINVLILGHEMEEKFVDFMIEFLVAKIFMQETIKFTKYYSPKADII